MNIWKNYLKKLFEKIFLIYYFIIIKIESIDNYSFININNETFNETPIKNINFGIEFIIREMINDHTFTAWNIWFNHITKNFF